MFHDYFTTCSLLTICLIIFLPKCSKKFMLLKWTINYLRILSWLDYALFPSFCQGVSGVMRKRLLSQNAEYQWNFTAVISTLFPFSFINIAKERMVQNSRNPLLYTANFSSWFLMPTQRTAWFGNMMVVIITKTTRDILSTSIKRYIVINTQLLFIRINVLFTFFSTANFQI